MHLLLWLCAVFHLVHNVIVKAAAKECSERYFKEVFNNENHKCRKHTACSIFEYDHLYENFEDDFEDKGRYSFSHTIESPESVAGERKTEPFKLVRTSFYLWNDLTLLANVFGALGLTIGFSVIGAIEWLTDKITALLGKAKFKREAVTSTQPCPQELKVENTLQTAACTTKFIFRVVWPLIIYFCVGLATLFFLQSLFNEFTRGLSTFQFSTQPLSTKDNPAVVLCFSTRTDEPFELGSKVNITVSQFMKDSEPEEQTVISQNSYKAVDVRISKLLLYNAAEYGNIRSHCFKMDTMRNDLTKWVTRIDVATAPGIRVYERINMFFTSAANSHGVITKKWLDGKVKPEYAMLGYLRRLNIAKITKQNYMSGRCTDQPYYDCLRSRLVEAGSTVCSQYGGFCRVASLPEPDGPIQKCSTQSAHNCSLNLFTKIMFHSQECKRPDEKLCSTVEFETDNYKDNKVGIMNWTYELVDIGNKDNCAIEYQLLRRSSSRGNRNHQPYQKVATENLVWTGLQFVVNFGGVLSMTIGFSVLCTAHWIMSKLMSLASRKWDLPRHMKTAANVILYIGAAILSIYFVGGVYKEYAAGASIMEESEKPVTILDNPTVTLCFESWSELNLGDHFEAVYALYDSDGKYDSHWPVEEDMMKKLFVIQEAGQMKRNCFMFMKRPEDLENMTIFLDIIISNPTIVQQYAWAYVTSEQNTYGAVTQKWYDGEVSKLHLERHKYTQINLDNIQEHNYLGNDCSPHSIYDCVSSQLQTTNTSSCAGHGGMCAAVSLPGANFQPCHSQAAYNCSLETFLNVFNSQQCNIQKACRVTEYKLGWSGKNDWPDATYSFGYQFDILSASQKRHIKPYKTVHTEVMIWDDFTLVTYILGTLGLTLGFSLPDVYNWMLKIFSQISKCKVCPNST